MRGLRSSFGLAMAVMAMAQAPPENAASVAGAVTHTLSGAPIPRAHISLRGSGPNARNYGALTTVEGRFSITGVVPDAYQASVDRVGFYMPAAPGGRATVEVVLHAGDKKEELKLQLAPLGSISGRVVDADGEPVESAAVAIDTGQGPSAMRDATDDKGRYRLEGLPPGKYRVKAAIATVLPTPPEIRTDGTAEVRYAPTYYGGATDYKSAARIEVKTGAEVNGIDIRLARMPMVRISGKVLGAPAEARSVSLMFAQTNLSRSMGGMKNDGTFQIWNTDPGKYFFYAVWTSGGQAVQTAPVEIEVGQTNIDNLELRVLPPSDISGQVVFDDDQARPQPAPKDPKSQQGSARGPTLELRTVDPGMTTGGRPTISDVAEDGSFHLTGVRPARYRVMLSWPAAWVKAVTLGSERVDGNVVNLRGGSSGAAVTVLVSSAFGSVSGTVSDASGPVAGARVALVRDDFVSVGDVTFATADSAGAYKIANVRPGAYRIAAIEDNDNAPRAGNLDDYEDILAAFEMHANEAAVKDLKQHPPVE
jgi:hypothetical protein